MSAPTIGCGITVTATNNTAQGNISFGSLSFLQDGSFDLDGYPPVILPTLAPGATGTLLCAAWAYAMGECEGTAVFNLPNGQPLNISWNLTVSGPANDMPEIVPGDGYAASGATSPTFSDGHNFVFNLDIYPQ